MKVIEPIEMLPAIESGTEAGLKWCVTLSPLKYFANGYVQLPSNHPFYSTSYEDIPVDVHGGLTYSENGVVGFDTGHFYDRWSEEEISRFGGKYNDELYINTDTKTSSVSWTMEALIDETKHLAVQLAKLA